MVKINTLFKLGAAVLCVVLLSSCGWLWRSVFPACEPASVQVPGGTINGTYYGWVADYPQEDDRTALQLVLDSSWVDDEHYDLQGEFILGDDAPLRLSATVDGGCGSEYVSTAEVDSQMQPLPGEELWGEVTDAGTEVWHIQTEGRYGFQLDPDAFGGFLINLELNSSFVFEVTRGGAGQ